MMYKRAALLTLTLAMATAGAEEFRPASWVFLPAIGSSPETGFQFGGYAMRQFAQTHADEPQDRLEVLLQGTSRGQFQALIWPNFYVSEGDWNIAGKLGGRYWPTTYFGQDNDVSLEAEGEVYELTSFVSEVSASYRITSRTYVGALAFADNESIDDDADESLLNESVRGFDGGVYSGVGVKASWDSRDDRDWPTRGAIIRGQVRQYTSLLGSELDFTTVYGAASQFVPVLDDVVSFSLSYQHGSSNTPFTRLPQPSGSNSLRGADGNRWTDNNLLGAQSEYRMTLTPRWAVVGFLDAAQVADTVDGFGVNRFHTTLGAGIRYATMADARFNIRADVGYVDMEQFGFTISVGEAF